MQTGFRTFIYAGIFIFCISGALSQSAAQGLDQAIKNKWVKARIKSLPTTDKRSTGSSYYGTSILLELENIRNAKTDINIETGRFLSPNDSSVQRMMVVEQHMITLNAGEKKEVTLKAFCSEMSKASPREATEFSIGKMATSHLLSLAKLLDKHHIFDYGAQNAIWCITDNNDLASIHSEKEEHTKLLREFVSKATGRKLVKEVLSHPEHTSTVNTKDTIVFSNREGGVLSLEFLNQEGEALHTFMKDKYHKPSTRHTIKYSIQYEGLPAGKYYIRLTRDGRIVYNKEILVKVIQE